MLDNDNFIASLKSRLNALNDDGTTQEQDSAALLSFYQWCKNAILDWEKNETQNRKPLGHDVFLPLMTAQVTVLPSGHEFFIEGARYHS